MENIDSMVQRIHWLGQAAVRIDCDGGPVYVDPFQLEGGEPAMLVLVTHDHSDHLSPLDLEKVLGPNTVVVAPEACREKLKGFSCRKVFVKPGAMETVGDVGVEAVPAYNVRKTGFHPKEKGYVGYVVTIAGVRIYHAGDTERIPEMTKIGCDIALIPLGQTYTMDSVEEAAKAALDVKAKVCIPIHFGKYEGSAADATSFSRILEGKTKVVVKAEE